jgi:3-hydroxybutyryl-CoA dehydratase
MEARTYTYTQELINQFAAFSGDFNPIHIDEEYAKTTPFKGTIAHGAIIEVLVSAELARKFPGVIITQKDDVRFKKPFRPGDVAVIETERFAVVDEGTWWIEKVEAKVGGEVYFEAKYVLRARKPKGAK